ncbi:hypothetical protein P8807_18995 [Bacillus subtilis]|uniref:hypothetical protein n=1 Tax=Bacillus subtilis group TaxID=653685 RepID=UPI001C3F8BD8|nr:MULTISPECIES: hypothetical protein [Bacillus subtilis group]MEC0413614.1 hypothetical protein [Bacillus subtilis]MEC0423274.1 hypothetical protein [Bacillus subtilis]MEC2292704.1 hypothetical protein [Bacillus licheniformis]
MFDLSGAFEWVQGQAKIVIYIVLIFVLVAMVWKRAWIAMVIYIIGVSAAVIFILEPDLLENIARWLAEITKVGG